MNILHSYRLRVFACLLAGLSSALHAQLEEAGRPLGDYRQMNAADVVYLLPPLHPLEIEAAIQSGGGPGAGSPVSCYWKNLHFALERPVSISPDMQGAWTQEGEYRVWRAHLISAGAYSLGLAFSEFRLEEGVKLLVYDPDMKQVRGAYTARNNKASGKFAVRHTPGKELIIELQVPARLEDYGSLTLASVSHAFLPAAVKGTADKRFGLSQSCEIDINCIEGQGWQLEKKAVVRLQTLTQLCTGVLLNNTAYNGDPLLITAQHCIDRQSIANHTVFEFNYESPSCFGGDGSVDRSIEGATLLSTGDSLDFSLLRLSSAPSPSFDVYYAGWDLAGGHGLGSATIHHPEGDVKKISLDYLIPVATDSPADIPAGFEDYLPDGFWWIRQWDVGSTEPGSSGSPLFNATSQVIGTLSFGKAFCGDSIGYDARKDRVIYNQSVSIDDYYTRLNQAWDHHPDPNRSLKTWLDPGGTGQTELGGFLPTGLPGRKADRGKSFCVFPNPSDGTLFISTLDVHSGTARYRIHDVSGALRLSGEAQLPGQVVIPVSGLEAGLYLLHVQAAEKSEVFKIMVAR
jgi:lysyl endopeptidase